MRKIKLDFDSPEPPDFTRIYGVLSLADVELENVLITRSQHNGWHVTLETKYMLENWEIVIFQALCGSDWKRETFNYIRVKALPMMRDWQRASWEQNWNVLFKADVRPGRDKVPGRKKHHRS